MNSFKATKHLLNTYYVLGLGGTSGDKPNFLRWKTWSRAVDLNPGSILKSPREL